MSIGTDTVKVTPKQLINILTATVSSGDPLMVFGPPGVGKTDSVYEAASKLKADTIVTHLSVSDPTDPKGIPWPDPEEMLANFLPFGDLYQAIHADRLTIWFLDDFGQAPPAVQAAYMQLLLARRVNDHVLSDNVVFVAATNRRTDKAGVSGILEPVKSRFVSLVELTTHLDDWVEWAFNHDIREEIIGYLRTRPDRLLDFEPTADMTNSPTPRGWAMASKILDYGLATKSEVALLSGAIGHGPATELESYIKMAKEMPDPDEVLEDPEEAEVPDNESVLYALCTALAYRANRKTIKNIIKYIKRLADELADGSGAEFATLLINDSFKRDSGIAETVAFDRFAQSELGHRIINA